MGVNASEGPPIGSSNLNFSLADTARFRADDYLEALHDAGYSVNGQVMEWTDIRIPRARQAAQALAGMGRLWAVHESWNELGLDNVVGVARQEGLASVLREIPVMGAFARLDHSYPRLGRIARAAPTDLPIIVHPRGQQLGGRLPLRPRGGESFNHFTARWIQPTVEWAAASHVTLEETDQRRLAAELDNETYLQGYDGMVLDLHHLRSVRAGYQFVHPVGLAEALAATGSVREVQLSLRPDFGGSRDEVAQVLAGKLGETTVGKMLKAVYRALPNPAEVPVITEIRANSLARAGVKRYLDAHKYLTAGIRQLTAPAS